MKWQRGHKSENVIDRRGARRRTTQVAAGGGGIVAILLTLFFGTDILGGGGVPGAGGTAAVSGATPGGAVVADQDKELVAFVSFVIDDIQAFWAKELPRSGGTWTPAKLVLFSDEVQSACGLSSAASGPFYCPADQLAYIDLGFYRVLKDRLGSPGDFAQAYVLAHEIGHHIQNITGVANRVYAARQRDPANANALSVRQELQADCYAGVWAHSTAQRDILERGDIEEGLTAASSIGDDTLQKQAGGRVRPESFTHGSSAQRVKWFRRGFASGRMADCDTFSGDL
ncbi:MAG: hypothetical protein CVU56_00975 [Deltaproteobacteria bacterium HGW-Deltaproteobacteria-14]|jgi:hypothetical protein|nr:MAG: hypothetical protein CVU56_00975 [Deltaproteobacteria bacterium HGW-Deltaproteobacteria-14]